MLRIALLSLIVALGLLAAGYMLIPRGAERALISLRDQDVDEAVTQYEAQYAAGDRSIGTLSALARIYEAQGRIAAAVRIAGELSFAYADPNRALQRQADIYRAGQEYGRAIEVLEEIPLDQRSASELRWLIGQYGLFGRLDPLIENLQEMVHRGIAGAEDTVELARVMAAQQRFEDAVAVLEAADDRSATVLPQLGQALLIHLLVARRETAEAMTRARGWAARERDPVPLLVFVAEQMRAAGLPQDAVDLLQPVADQAPEHPNLQAALVESWIAAGAQADALAAMQGWAEAGTLAPDLVPRLTDVALLLGDYAAARAAIASRPPESLGAQLLTAFVDAARQRGDAGAIRDLDARLSPDYLAKEPILEASIALALGDRARARNVVDRAIARVRGAGDRQRLAALLQSLDEGGRALEVMRAVPSLAAMSQSYLTQLASLFLAAGRAREGLALFEALRSGDTGSRADPGWAVLAAAEGQGAAVAQWLAGTGQLSLDVLRDLNGAATAARLPELALETARRLAARDDSTDTQLRLVSALVLAGRAGEAKDLLDRLPQDTAAARTARIEVLTALGDKAGLRAIYAAELDRPDASRAERDQAAFDLLSVGGAAQALDYLEMRAAEAAAAPDGEQWLFAFADAARDAGETGRLTRLLEEQLLSGRLTATQTETRLSLLADRAPADALRFLSRHAERRGGAWAAAYQELLRSSGDRSALAAFLLEQGLDSRTPADRRREAAFGLLDLGDKAGAVRIFQTLAAGGSADSGDARQLAYLWGPRPGPAALDWVESQALAAGGAERAGWLDLLGSLGGGPRLIALVDAGRITPEAAGEGYLGALLRAGRRDTLRGALTAAIDRTTQPQRLQSLAGIAERARMAELAESAWQRLLSVKPDDPQAIRQLAGYAAADGRYARARDLLLRYIGLARPGYDDLYALAEAERALGMTDAAAERYRQAAALIDAQAAPSFDARILRAQIAHRLGRSGEAIAIFDRLYAERPGDLGLRDDFAEVLLDLGDVDRARSILR
ncbi:hypothetical protein ACFOGJ_06430 [Marinibaculum pumilum]|uniref:Tetratricopeptide repeat protein n=1 Tax=Marinibaculum pumilum TaxID=1766165 RepID=A0ABV7KX67_9PROT